MLTPQIRTFQSRHSDAQQLLLKGQYGAARTLLEALCDDPGEETAAILNDLAVLDSLAGDFISARSQFAKALQNNVNCNSARKNLERLSQSYDPVSTVHHTRQGGSRSRIRVAIVSLLFNWPSTGGGTIHTYESAKFLSEAGYDVRQIYARNDEWGLGLVTEPLAVEGQELRFSREEWTPDEIRFRFRAAVDEFAPDLVIITDSWNTKPLLAEAVQSYPYFLRIAAMEGLCPLNNVRLLVEQNSEVRQCSNDQLTDARTCQSCVKSREGATGSLHRAERALAGFDEPSYSSRLKRTFSQAAAVLVVNPSIAQIVRPYCRQVCIVPSGFDRQRFDRCLRKPQSHYDGRKRIVFAGLVDEFMKGFPVLHAAAEKLWQERRDFELIVTADSQGRADDFTRFVGWQSQTNLPSVIAAADILAFPTLAQEALGRSAVEAMGCARPVVASRLGGLSWVVDDEATGLLFEPGNTDELARQLRRLLDDPLLATRFGKAGRRKFEQEFTWDVILQKHYIPLIEAVKPRSE